MKRSFIIGVTGGFFGLAAALFVLVTATSNEYTLSGVQAALFSSMGLMGAAIAASETKFAGWMLLSSAVWILITAPLAGTLNILYLYAPAIICFGSAGLIALLEPQPEEQNGSS
ncbi:MAG: hypothetical protein NTY71_04155 [Methanoregula sp.]|jgi:uncharacterized membrane protein HdeD (DUF308 family)|nr:hypothetical protein [Methanoregula sp.]